MKKIFTLLSVIVISVAASAQYYQVPFVNAGQNPGGLNTDADQTAAYMLANSTGYTQVLSSGDTDWSTAETIPFSFTFNGTAYTSVYIAPNGVVSFTSSTGAGPGTNVALPAATIPDNSICAWGLNLGGGNDGVIVKTHGTSPNRQYWVTWASASWSQGAGWAYWSIVLEETTNKVYVVDARTYISSGSNVALTAGIQFNSTTAMSVSGSPALAAVSPGTGGSDVGPADNSYYAFVPGTQPNYDAAMSDIDMPNFLQLGQGGADVEATITNMGAQTITSLELSYTVAGGAAVVSNVTGLNIVSGASATVTHPTVWNPTTESSFNIEFWASSINGNPDSQPANDKTDKDVTTYNNSYPRIVLYETFTGSTCAPCKPGNENFESVLVNIPDSQYTSVKYQMSWPGTGDPYNTADGNTRRGYYAINSIPRLEADGGWDGNSGSFTMAVHNDAIQVPAFVKIEATYSVDVPNKKVNTCATITAMQNLGNATLHIAIKENHTTANVKSNGETEFFDVVKKMVTDGNGQSVNITSGMSQTICEDYTFQGSYRLPNSAADLINDATEHSVEGFTDLAVVVWLQDDATMEVFNSADAISSNPTCDSTTFIVTGTVVDNQTTGSITLAVSGAVAPYTYSWTGPNGFTSTSKDLSGLISQGNYTVVVTDDDVCTKTETFTVAGIVTVQPLNAINNISIFPNPAVDNTIISINSIKATIASIKVLDLVGKTIINMNNVNLGSGKNIIRLNTSNLDGGVYLVEITNNGVVVTSKLVIQK